MDVDISLFGCVYVIYLIAETTIRQQIHSPLPHSNRHSPLFPTSTVKQPLGSSMDMFYKNPPALSAEGKPALQHVY